MHNWPVLHLRVTDNKVVAHGPSHAVFGNPYRASPSVSIPTDPFAEWTWDGTRLKVVTDRYGFFPIFYHTTRDTISVSPSLMALLDAGAPSTIDDAALGVLLRTGFLVGDDTVFRDIRVMPPHGVLTWEHGKCDVTGRFVLVGAESYTHEAAIDAYIERMRESVRRRPEVGTSIVPLSGGRDSRHIFLELCAQERRPQATITVDTPPTFISGDVPVAHALSDRAGVKHIVLPLVDSRWTAETENTLRTHFSTFEHFWFRPLLNYLGEHGSKLTMYEGVAGDVLSTFFLKTPERQRLYAEGKFEALAELFFWPEEYFKELLSPAQYRRSTRDAARSRLAQELARHADAPHPLASFLVYNRTRRVTAISPSTMFSPWATVWCPYLDADVFDFLMSLTPDILKGPSDQSFHDSAILRAYPKFADIAFSAKHVPTARSLSKGYELRMVADMARDIARYTPRLVRKRYLYPRLTRAAIDPGYRPEISNLVAITAFFAQLSRYSTKH